MAICRNPGCTNSVFSGECAQCRNAKLPPAPPAMASLYRREAQPMPFYILYREAKPADRPVAYYLNQRAAEKELRRRNAEPGSRFHYLEYAELNTAVEPEPDSTPTPEAP